MPLCVLVSDGRALKQPSAPMRLFDQLDEVGVEGHEVEVAIDVSWELGARSSRFDLCRAPAIKEVPHPSEETTMHPSGGHVAGSTSFACHTQMSHAHWQG